MKTTKNALIVVDLQNDFMPGGALGVKNGDETVAIANKLMPLFEIVVASQDWHPKNHGCFSSQNDGKKVGDRVLLAGIEQIVWPEHCVQNTKGSELVSTLEKKYITIPVFKGTDPQIHSYSTFFDDAHRNSTGLENRLKDKGVTDVYLLGLATDYCLKYSVLDALELGFNVYVVPDGCRGIADHDKALEEMQRAGAHLISSDDVKARFS